MAVTHESWAVCDRCGLRIDMSAENANGADNLPRYWSRLRPEAAPELQFCPSCTGQFKNWLKEAN